MAKSSGTKDIGNMRTSSAATSQARGLLSKAKGQPAQAGKGEKHGPAGRSASAQKADAKP